MTNIHQTLLSNIDSPHELRKLSPEQLPQLSHELRQFIIEAVAENPGHLGSSLGTVELTVALHYVFNTPDDRIVWDVGHQAYPHKILTGRKDRFVNNRKYLGISGFPKMSESIYDAFGTGHSSTSISATLGMAIASSINNDFHRQHIAVIGDGSLTGGMAFEALNQAGVEKTNLLVVINDNGISIDKNVGGLSKYFTKITSSRPYNRLRNKVWNLLGGNAGYNSKSRHFLGRTLAIIKAIIFRESNLFEILGFRYFGPIDGHDIRGLLKTLEAIKDIKGPKVLHVVTKKGKGLASAENDPTRYHAPGQYNSETGAIIPDLKNANLPDKFQDVFGKTLVELAQINAKIVGITPAMPSGCSMSFLMDAFPERTFDVGIAEQHAVTFSAGLAAQGMTPFCNIYSSFMQRGADQVIHDVALQRLPVIFCLDRAGLVGEDGATHHGVFDLALFRCIPHLIIAAPMDEVELRNLMFTAQNEKHDPFLIRYPRGRGLGLNWHIPMQALPLGKGRQLRQGEKIAFVSLGDVGKNVQAACQQLQEKGFSTAHYDLRFLKPLDEAMLHEVMQKYEKVICVENGIIAGGMGSALLEFAQEHRYTTPIYRKGIPDRFIEQGSIAELQKECGFDAESLANFAESLL